MTKGIVMKLNSAVKQVMYLSLMVLISLGCTTTTIDSDPNVNKEINEETGDVVNPARDQLLERRIERW